MVAFLRDVKNAARSLRRNPGFSVVVVLTLALGIGGNTAILSVAHTIFFAPLPFPDSEHLVRIRATNAGPGAEQNAFNLRGAEIQSLERQGTTSPFSAIVSLAVQNRTLTGGETPERVSVSTYHGGWSEVLGIQPVSGRWFSSEEERRGDQSGVAIISADLWARRFAGSPDVLGKSMTLDNHALTIIGVMPEGFHFPYETEMWTPVTMVTQSVDDYAVFGRLKPGVSQTAASHALTAVAATLVQQYPNLYGGAGLGLKLWPIRESFVGEQKRAATATAAVGGFFLLLASFNIANLLLVRSVTRRRELQIRAALGAGRWQLIRQNLAETLVLAMVGAIIGVLLAGQINPYLVSFIPTVLTRQLNMTVRAAGLFSFGAGMLLSFITTVAAGLLSAITSASSANPDGVGRASTRTSRSRRERFLMDSFVVLEFTLALALIAGANLMVRNLTSLSRRDLGIDAAHLLAVHVSTTDPHYASAESRQRLAEQVVAAAESAPGVAAAGIGTVNPLGGTTWTAPIAIEGKETQGSGAVFAVNHRLVTPRWFDSMGIRLLQGRAFTNQDDASSPGVAIVSREMAQKYWPNAAAIGKRVRLNRPGRPWLEVVGIVSNVEDSIGDGGPRETWYLPYAQNAGTPAAADIVLMARTPGDPRSIEQGIERSIHGVNKELALYDASTLDRYYLDTLRQQKTGSILISALAGFGLLLGSLGLYGTLSFTVGERVREIGIRMALGAGHPEILRMIMMHGLRLSLLGAVLGVGAAMALGRLLSSQLSEVRAGDPLALFGAMSILLTVACCAIYWPARRAAGLDPYLALRRE